MPANIMINFNTSSSANATGAVDSVFASQDSISMQTQFANGSAANQCDLICEKRGPAVASPEVIDLSLISDQNGNDAAFASVKGLIIVNKGEENALEVSGSFFGTTPAIAIPPGGALVLMLPGGQDITADSNDIINVGSAAGTEYELRVVGVAVVEEAGE